LLGHERFEELACLAVVGELSPKEWREFAEHRAACAQCRDAVGAFSDLAASAFQAGAPAVLPGNGDRRKERARATVYRNVFGSPARRRIYAGVPAAVLLTAAGVLAGFLLGRFDLPQQIAPSPFLKVAAPPVMPKARVEAADVSGAQAELGRYRELSVRLRQDAGRQATENASLRNLLTSAEQRAAALESAIRTASQEFADQSQELSKTTADLTTARKGLAEAQSAMKSNAGTISDLRSKLADAETQLAQSTDSLDRERQMLAAEREIRDIMGARDVHIVDVFDIDGKGRAKKPFGRAFYTQGKSLVFYAFDLPVPKKDKSGEFAYFAWGRNSAAGRAPTHRLGIFYNDDRAQQRWTMKFDDPKVLSEIDTVFVTLEPSWQDHAGPTGKPILDAYFGTPPNHP
jgi:hypothetical protein